MYIKLEKIFWTCSAHVLSNVHVRIKMHFKPLHLSFKPTYNVSLWKNMIFTEYLERERKKERREREKERR